MTFYERIDEVEFAGLQLLGGAIPIECQTRIRVDAMKALRMNAAQGHGGEPVPTGRSRAQPIKPLSALRFGNGRPQPHDSEPVLRLDMPRFRSATKIAESAAQMRVLVIMTEIEFPDHVRSMPMAGIGRPLQPYQRIHAVGLIAGMFDDFHGQSKLRRHNPRFRPFKKRGRNPSVTPLFGSGSDAKLFRRGGGCDSWTHVPRHTT